MTETQDIISQLMPVRPDDPSIDKVDGLETITNQDKKAIEQIGNKIIARLMPDSPNMKVISKLHPCPIADFSATPLTGTEPLSVQFTDKSDFADSWEWFFGDTVTSEDQNPNHEYSAGTYTVELVAKNTECQDYIIKENYIVVESADTRTWVYKWFARATASYVDTGGTTTPGSFFSVDDTYTLNDVPVANREYITEDGLKKYVVLTEWVDREWGLSGGYTGNFYETQPPYDTSSAIPTFFWRKAGTSEIVTHPIGSPDVLGGSSRIFDSVVESLRVWNFREIAYGFAYYEFE